MASPFSSSFVSKVTPAYFKDFVGEFAYMGQVQRVQEPSESLVERFDIEFFPDFSAK